MSGTMILGGCAVLVAILIWKRNKHRKENLAMLMAVANIRRASLNPEPDLNYAAKGYAQVAVTRRYGKGIDLHHLEHAHALDLLKGGCNRNQALSARWGGAFAISDDPANLDGAMMAYRQAYSEAGATIPSSPEHLELALHQSALMIMTTAHATDNGEYARFLRHLGEPT